MPISVAHASEFKSLGKDRPVDAMDCCVVDDVLVGVRQSLLTTSAFRPITAVCNEPAIDSG
tara:strand:- start:143023 stop:143205 length:183 start_codon:yes stop_codon:yes gene_type:complete